MKGINCAFRQAEGQCRVNFKGYRESSEEDRAILDNPNLQGRQWENWQTLDLKDWAGVENRCRGHYDEPDLAASFRERTEADREALWQTSLDNFDTLKKAYQLGGEDSGSSGHEKRSLLAVGMALPVVGLGATLWEGIRMRKHLRELRGQFAEFADTTQRQFDHQLKFNREVIELFQGFNGELRALACDTTWLTYQPALERKIGRWERHTRTILSGVLANELTIGVLPELLNLASLERLVTENPVFQGSIFIGQPETIYTLGKMTLMGMQRNDFSWKFHFVLTVPLLHPGSVYPRYSVAQVGIKVNHTCLLFEMAEEVYRIGDRFYEVRPGDGCYDRDALLKVCLRPTHGNAVEEHVPAMCLNGRRECKSKLAVCEDRTVFTVAGALVFSETPVRGIKAGNQGGLTFQEIESNRTGFYSWLNYSYLMINHRMMASSREVAMHQELQLPDVRAWEDHLQATSRALDNGNVTRLAKQLTKQEETQEDLAWAVRVVREERGEWGWLDIISLIGIALNVISFGLIACSHWNARMGRYKAELRGWRALQISGPAESDPKEHQELPEKVAPPVQETKVRAFGKSFAFGKGDSGLKGGSQSVKASKPASAPVIPSTAYYILYYPVPRIRRHQP
eukprot:sb/3463022/